MGEGVYSSRFKLPKGENPPGFTKGWPGILGNAKGSSINFGLLTGARFSPKLVILGVGF